jgi:hypothetical protein
VNEAIVVLLRDVVEDTGVTCEELAGFDSAGSAWPQRTRWA